MVSKEEFSKYKGNLKALLDEKVETYNHPSFIQDDPISIPHQFTKLQDIEIIGFWVAMLAWGQRKTILQSGQRLVDLMEGAPHDFILNHTEKDRQRFEYFKHRTFQYIDSLYFLEFFQWYYTQADSLEDAFAQGMAKNDETTENALINFQKLFFSLPDAPRRTRKHVATPASKSRCKRLNMFLRWMVRKDEKGVDFGLWQKIKPSQLLMPLDVHVDRIMRQFQLIQRKQTDWLTVLELTERLKQLDPEDPVKYDFALFGMGVIEKSKWSELFSVKS